MSKQSIEEFFELYQKYRYDDQIKFYRDRVKEFEHAHSQAIWISIILLGLTALAGGLGATNSFPAWVKLTCQIAAVILPVLSTTIIAYDGLYDFEQQAKFYRDSITNLLHARRDLNPTSLKSLDDIHYVQRVEQYVKDVEKVFHDEQGQWGQLAKKPDPQQQ